MGKMEKHLAEVVNVSWNFAGRINDQRGHELNAFIGLASEAGECLDIIKKKHFHSPKDDEHYKAKLLSELGDIGFYWLKAIDVSGLTVKEVLDYNRKKLESRHPELGVVKERFGAEAIKG